MLNYIICDNHATLEIGSQTESIILWASMFKTCYLSNVAGYAVITENQRTVNCVLYKTIVVYISMVKLAYLGHFLYSAIFTYLHHKENASCVVLTANIYYLSQRTDRT